MPFVPRPPIPTVCAHCQNVFESRHLRRKYCCNSCNVLAAQARKKVGASSGGESASPAVEFALPARFIAAVGPVQPVGSYFLLMSDERSFEAAATVRAHRFQAAQAVAWLTSTQEYFPRRDFAVDTQGTVWLEAYGFADRWFPVVTIEGLEA
ncbi:hypothetical protein [Hymenobacter guriensis]|uniref:Uncharacterized protein n=1 Tax=Hymenobacter guriensis TaxID=2793065 RepID=A0ABS0L8A9_9BACT|nr:hypothetical protein [Hymenobacter guriensis]MBG8556140.1 hypothetical protein [Hymenobacter guriensis]